MVSLIMSKKLRILIVEDSEEDALLLVRELKRGGFELSSERVDTREAMRASLAGKEWDIIVSDHAMPHFNSLGALEVLKETGKDIPFIIVSGSIGEETAVTLMKAGALDYIMKDNLKRLVPAIERELAEAEVRERKRLAEDRLMKSETRYRLLFEGMMDAFALLERIESGNDVPDFLYVDLNESYAAVMGLPREKILSKTLREIYPQLETGLVERYDAIAATGIPDHFEHFSGSSDRHFEISAYSPRAGHVATIIRDVTARKIAAERQGLMNYILEAINRESNSQAIIQDILSLLKMHYHFDAIGLRLKQNGDFPYFLLEGLNHDFLKTDNTLCARDERGGVITGAGGEPALECLCGLVLTGRTDPAAPYFSAGGSFWSNDISLLPEASIEAALGAHIRGRCAREGFKSMALIPLRSGEEIAGLLQFLSFKENRLSPDLIRFFESVGLTLGIALKRRWIEKEVQDSEEKFRQLFNLESDSILLIDNKTGEILEANESASALYGYGHEELIRMKNTDLSTEPDLTRKAIEERATSIPIRYYRKKDGNVFPVEITASYMSWKGRSVQISAIRDISERVRAEADLRKSEERYRLIANNMSDSIWLMDMTFKYTYATPSLMRDFGRTMEELNEIPLAQTMTPGSFSRIQKVMAEELTPGRLADKGIAISRTIELEFIHKDGSTFWGEVSYELIRDAEGNPRAILGVGRNITARKDAEDKIKNQLDELRRWHETTVGREMRVIELKSEVNELLAREGKPPRYASANEDKP
jgi:PAS domain S-box-containing protein